ncbi:tubulin-specific chaperone D-like isoform X2 [Hyperolius riggenbachi]|uniref:tubulin-specific chaperone D-like isoform X2 n=1 Tax=Hyperolius riggenbachi TaxID=752182 RepID=UPI0035A387C6
MTADRAEREEDGSPEIVSSGNILGSFTESKQTRDLIVNLQMSCMELVSREVCAQRFKVIMDYYQEQPHLLDPHLGSMLELSGYFLPSHYQLFTKRICCGECTQ